MRSVAILLKAEWADFRRRPLRWLLAVAGIAIGVALVVGVDLLTSAALRGYSASLAVAHVGFSHSVSKQHMTDLDFVRLRQAMDAGRLPRIRRAVAVVQARLVVNREANATAPMPGVGDRDIVELLGVDAFAWAQTVSGQGTLEPGVAMLEPGTVLVDRATAQVRGWALNTMVRARRIDGTPVAFRIAGFLQSDASAGWLIADIASVQELAGLQGRLSRIDIDLDCDSMLDAGRWKVGQSAATCTQSAVQAVQSVDPDFVLRDVDELASADLADAFYFNLSTLSWLAAAVAAFLVHQVGALEINQRTLWFAQLRAIGFTASMLSAVAVVRAALLGTIAAGIGLSLGNMLAAVAVSRMLRVVSDLFYRSAVSEVSLSAFVVAKALVVAVGVAVASSAWMMRGMAVQSLPSQLRGQTVANVRSVRVGQVLVFVTAAIWIVFTVYAAWAVLAAIALLLFACTPLAAWFAALLARASGLLELNVVGKVAFADVRRTTGEARFSSGALIVALAAAVGMGIMIDSFERALNRLLDQRLQPTWVVRSEVPIPKALIVRIRELPGVSAVTATSYDQRDIGGSTVAVRQVDRADLESRRLGLPENALAQGVVVNEPLARTLRIEVGDSLLEQGRRHRVAGIFKDYGSMRGVLVAAGAVQSADELMIYGADTTQRSRLNLLSVLADLPVQIGSNDEIRRYSLTVFERTFALTRLVRVLAVAVATIALVLSLLAWIDRRLLELGVLRAIGFTRSQLVLVLGTQAFVIGGLCVLVALPLGVVVGWLLVEFLNPRAFLWSFPLYVDLKQLALLVLLAFAAVGLATCLPALRLLNGKPRDWLMLARHG